MKKEHLTDATVAVNKVLAALIKACVAHGILLLICFSLLQPTAHGQIRVGLLSDQKVTSVMISPNEGSYMILNVTGDTIYRFRSDDAVSISISGHNIIAKSAYGLCDTLSSLSLMGSGSRPSFKFRADHDQKDRIYYESLEVGVDKGKLKLVNTVSLERYVSRVVQAEVGYGAADEFYKIQSIICRTYAVRNTGRHAADGFDVCDHQHCQVYSGLKTPTEQVVKATAATAGTVMVSKENDLILSAFHANCGGQTANSEDVWKEERSYLRSVKDTFCLSSRSAVWEMKIPVQEFLTQLDLTPTSIDSSWAWSSETRSRYFRMNTDSVETTAMRRMLSLRSSFFDVEVTDGTVSLLGKGYGHGVGLCQQGAMKMAESGYTYSQILGYFYKGVSLIPVSSLQLSE
ncbi:MAG: hypothetical protein RL266_1751 [Bacteroidota bacterium]